MTFKRFSFLIFTFCYGVMIYGQKAKVATVGFYNLENLFDTVNDTTINDEEFLPEGKRNWTEEKYLEKQANMAYVISQIGTDIAPQGLSVLGVSEVENLKVLQDLVSQPSIKNRNYQIVHYDSKDFRGIDVALIYNPEHFKVDSSRIIDLPILRDGVPYHTRDILYVAGKFDGESMIFLVNHWPSRRGGEQTTAPDRNKGAQLCRDVVDDALSKNPEAKVWIMGDLNDDPTSESLKGYLRTKAKVADVKPNDVFNPFEDFYRRGIGTGAYRDNWSLFDNIIFTEPLLEKPQDGYYYIKAGIFNKKWLVQPSGQYKGYPFRTFSFDTYQHGYSDHFPVYVVIAKNVE